MTRYSPEDYEWVKRFISKHPKGVSVKDIVQDSREEGIKLIPRPRDEKPPGREKIHQIVKDYAGKDWDYKIGGGKGKHSVLKPKEVDPLAGWDNAAREMMVSARIRSLDELYKKRNEKFTVLEIIELYRIKESVIAYPMRSLYLDARQGHDKEILFNRALGIAKDQIKRIKRIETIQKRVNGRFEKTLISLDQIRDSNLFEAEIFENRSKYKNFLNPRNTIRSMYRIVPKK